MGVPHGVEKETEKESGSRTFPIDRTLRWQRPDAATQRSVDSREVQSLWNRDRTCPVVHDRTQAGSGQYSSFLQMTGRWIPS